MTPKGGGILYTIYDPQISHSRAAILDLVLVHGLNGDHIESWTHQQSGICWPRDLLPKQLPGIRVSSFSYSADVYGNTSVAGIRDNAQNLLSCLRDLKEEEGNDRPLVFVAHSLGGIIVKQALRMANNDRVYNFLATSTRGLIFFGTPHAGSDQKRWLPMAKKFAPLVPGSRFIGWRRPSPLVESLTRNSRELQTICDDFRHLASDYDIMSFYEIVFFPGSKSTIVGKTSAVMGLPREEPIPLDQHHMDMIRFESESDSGFLSTCTHIERIMIRNGLSGMGLIGQ
ncbi:Alpha/Beta hydrolase protein [Chaetomium sp. MPI-CAGE-AT-0009]|nr:Alpha/Beta hydrolase protein [Chaetomium sp. MPI-CAGE-AT-0009]